MTAEMGEYLVGAYLELVEGCEENSQGESEVNVQKARAELENLEKKLGHSRF